jgi:hypothetical protein
MNQVNNLGDESIPLLLSLRQRFVAVITKRLDGDLVGSKNTLMLGLHGLKLLLDRVGAQFRKPLLLDPRLQQCILLTYFLAMRFCLILELGL